MLRTEGLAGRADGVRPNQYNLKSYPKLAQHQKKKGNAAKELKCPAEIYKSVMGKQRTESTRLSFLFMTFHLI